jgi:hypothetical protein
MVALCDFSFFLVASAGVTVVGDVRAAACIVCGCSM